MVLMAKVVDRMFLWGGCIVHVCVYTSVDIYSLSSKMSYHQIQCNFEANNVCQISELLGSSIYIGLEIIRDMRTILLTWIIFFILA